MLKRQRGGQAEAQMLRHQRHRGDQCQRIVDRNLRRLADRRVAAAVQYVIDPQHVGDEQPVELAALQQPPDPPSTPDLYTARSDPGDAPTGPATDGRRSSYRKR